MSVARFLKGWQWAADCFIASGWIDPARFRIIVERLGLCEADIPDQATKTALLYVYLCAEDGATPNLDTLCRLIPTVDRADIERMVFAYGTDVNMLQFGKWCKEYGTRVVLYRSRRDALDTARPIGELCREVLAMVEVENDAS